MEIHLEGGERAEARTFDGSHLTFVSPRAFAPGAPIRFTARTDSAVRSFEGRAIGSKRVDEGRFEVRMRFVNLRRNDRSILSALPAP
jgi:hypothetical protein